MSKHSYDDFRNQPDESSEFWVYAELPDGRFGYLPFEPNDVQRAVLELLRVSVCRYGVHPPGVDGLALYNAYCKRGDEPQQLVVRTAEEVEACTRADITDAELDALFEQSKDDKVIVVGSDIRRLIGALRRARARNGKLETDIGQIRVSTTNEVHVGLNTLRDAAHRNSREKGFWDGQRSCPRCVDVENRAVLLRAGVDPDTACGVCQGTKLTDKLDRDAVIKTIPEKLCLIHSEVSEALECYRDKAIPKDQFHASLVNWESDHPDKPVGFVSELADVLIRVFDLAGALGIDLDEAVRVKMRYNATRERMHGKSC